MKKLIYLSIVLGIVISSCSKDDGPDVSPIVGQWVLDKITVSDPPAGHTFAVSPTPSSTILAESRYEIEFLADNKYERTIEETIFGRVDDDGTWEIVDNEVELIQENTNVDDLPVLFEIDGDITDRKLTLITTDFWFAWPPEIVNDPNAPLDTLTQDELQPFFNEHGVIVPMTFELEFDRQ